MGSKMTICEVHRQIHRLVKGKMPVEIKGQFDHLLETAFVMGKKMDNKLRQYSNKWDKDWWEKNKLAGGTIDEPDTRTNKP